MKTNFECMECGQKFKRTLRPKTMGIVCPKCHSIDVEVEDVIIIEKASDTVMRERFPQSGITGFGY